uniref:Uncharacterized protein n=1 Tax=Fagus sylvatica TaxID=28930 RepID=A0A2N9GQE0_FAGSY
MALQSVSPIPSLLRSSNGSSLTQPLPLKNTSPCILCSHHSNRATATSSYHQVATTDQVSPCILCSHHSNLATVVDAAASSHHRAGKVSLQASNLSFSLFTDPSDQATRKAPIHSLSI